MSDTITHPQKRAFLSAYAELGNVTRAAAIAGISRESHYDWKAEDPDYAAAFERAVQLAGDALEDEARRRAVDGVEEYVISRGEVVRVEGVPLKKTRYSDTLLALLLKGAKPRVYREHVSAEISGVDGKPVSLAVDLSGLSDDELNTLRSLAQKTAEPASD